MSTLLSAAGGSGDLVGVSRGRASLRELTETTGSDTVDAAVAHERAVLQGMNLTAGEAAFAEGVGRYMEAGDVSTPAEADARDWAATAMRDGANYAWTEAPSFELRDVIAAVSQLAASAPASPGSAPSVSDAARVDPAVASAIAAALHELEPSSVKSGSSAALRSTRVSLAVASASAAAYAQVAVPAHIAGAVDVAVRSAVAAHAAVEAVLKWLVRTEAALQLGLGEDVQRLSIELQHSSSAAPGRAVTVEPGMASPSSTESDPFVEFENTLDTLVDVESGVADADAAIKAAAAYMRRLQQQASRRRAAFRAARRSRVILVASERACAVHARRLDALRELLRDGAEATILQPGTAVETVVSRAIQNASALAEAARGAVEALSLGVSSSTAALLLQESTAPSSPSPLVSSPTRAPELLQGAAADAGVVTQVAAAARAVRVASEVLQAETARVRASSANSATAAQGRSRAPTPSSRIPSHAAAALSARAPSSGAHETSITNESAALRQALAAFAQGGSSLNHRHYFPAALVPGTVSGEAGVGGRVRFDSRSSLDANSSPATLMTDYVVPVSSAATAPGPIAGPADAPAAPRSGPLLSQKMSQLSEARSALLRSVRALTAVGGYPEAAAYSAETGEAAGDTPDDSASGDRDELIASPKLLPSGVPTAAGSGPLAGCPDVPRSLARLLRFVDAASAAAVGGDPGASDVVAGRPHFQPGSLGGFLRGAAATSAPALTPLSRGSLVSSDTQSALIAARLRRFHGRRESLASADDDEVGPASLTAGAELANSSGDASNVGAPHLAALALSRGQSDDAGVGPAHGATGPDAGPGAYPHLLPQRPSSGASGRSPHPHAKLLPVTEAGLSPAAEAHPREPRGFLLSALDRRGTSDDGGAAAAVAAADDVPTTTRPHVTAVSHATPGGAFGSAYGPGPGVPPPLQLGRRTLIVQAAGAAGSGRVAAAPPPRSRPQAPPRSVPSMDSLPEPLHHPPAPQVGPLWPGSEDDEPPDASPSRRLAALDEIGRLRLPRGAPRDDASLPTSETAATGLGHLIDAAVRR